MPKPKRPKLAQMQPDEIQAWLVGQIGDAPFQSLEGIDTDEAMATLELGVRKHKPAVKLLTQIMQDHPDTRLRINAADGLLCFDDKKVLKAIADQLDFKAWDGGLLCKYGVSAIFKSSPKTARKKLKPAFDHALAQPEEGHRIALTALQVVLQGVPPYRTRSAAWNEARNMPEAVIEEDRKGWLDLCYAMRTVSANTVQNLPLGLLYHAGDERWLDAAFDAFEVNGVPSMCLILRGFDDPAAVPGLEALAKKTKGADKKTLAETIKHLSRKRKKGR